MINEMIKQLSAAVVEGFTPYLATKREQKNLPEDGTTSVSKYFSNIKIDLYLLWLTILAI